MPLYRNQVYEWQGDGTQPYPNNYTWKSRKWIFPYKVTFTHARIIAETQDRQDYYDSVIARNEILRRNRAKISGLLMGGSISEDPIGQLAINGDALEDVPTVADYAGDYALTVKFYTWNEDAQAMALHFTKEVYAHDTVFPIEEGYRGRMFEVEIIGNCIIERFDMASTVEELKS
jgi:hypothetical protein